MLSAEPGVTLIIASGTWQLRDDFTKFPWFVIAGKALTDCLVIDMGVTLAAGHSNKETAAPIWKNSLA